MRSLTKKVINSSFRRFLHDRKLPEVTYNKNNNFKDKKIGINSPKKFDYDSHHFKNNSSNSKNVNNGAIKKDCCKLSNKAGLFFSNTP